jgi:hypothetical protein
MEKPTMVRLKKPKHRQPYPKNKSTWWQIKDRIKHELHMTKYRWRDLVAEIKDIVEEIKSNKF